MAGDTPDRWTVLRRGMRTTIHNNMSAFGYSLLATASFGALSHSLGSPGFAEIFLFAGGAIAAFVILEAALSNLSEGSSRTSRNR